MGEAAVVLGISNDAVRMRIRRGTLRSEKTDDRVYVWLDDAQNADHGAVHHGDEGAVHYGDEGVVLRELIDELRDRVRALEESNRENRRIIAALTSRIPELTSPDSASYQEPSEAPETVADNMGRGDVPGDHSEAQQAKAARRAWGKEWEMRLVGGLAAIAVVSALLLFAFAVLSP